MGEQAFDITVYKGLQEEMPLDTLEKARAYLLVGQSGNYVRVSPGAYTLLKAIRSGMTVDEVAAALHERGRTGVTARQLEDAYASLTSQLARIEEQAARDPLPSGFWWRITLLPRELVCHITPALTRCFDPRIVLVMLALLAWTIARGLALPRPHLAEETFLTAYALFILSLVVHEFGHAAACTRFGVQPNEIGFALYLVFPAFYTDVSRAWELGRWQRVVVDLAGNYFQLITGAAFLAVWYLTAWPAFQIAFLMIVYSAIFSLNPIFKFDGYWALADMLGVTNLGRQPIRITKHAVAYVTGRSMPALPWPAPIVWLLGLYSVCSVLIWGKFLMLIGPIVWSRIASYHVHFNEIAAALISMTLPTWGMVRALLVSTFMLLLATLMLWRLWTTLVQPGVRATVRWSRRTSARYRARTAGGAEPPVRDDTPSQAA